MNFVIPSARYELSETRSLIRHSRQFDRFCIHSRSVLASFRGADFDVSRLLSYSKEKSRDYRVLCS